MTTTRRSIAGLDPRPGTPGQVPMVNPEGTAVEYADTPGGIQTIAPGPGIEVDDTDPLNPVVSATGGGSANGAGELLMQDGVTAPPVPLETEARDDWLYQG